MHFLRSNYLNPTLFALFVGVFPQLCVLCEAQTLLLYDFEDSSGNFELSAELAAAGIEPQAWTVLSSSIRDFTGNPGRAMASSGFSVSNAFQLEVNVQPGSSVQLTEFGFDQLASSSGPMDWQLQINGLTIANGHTSESFAREAGAISLAPLHDTFTIGLIGSGASSSRGTFRIDNFSLSGDIQAVPLPASVSLLAAACVGLGRCHRKRNNAVMTQV